MDHVNQSWVNLETGMSTGEYQFQFLINTQSVSQPSKHRHSFPTVFLRISQWVSGFIPRNSFQWFSQYTDTAKKLHFWLNCKFPHQKPDRTGLLYSAGRASLGCKKTVLQMQAEDKWYARNCALMLPVCRAVWWPSAFRSLGASLLMRHQQKDVAVMNNHILAWPVHPCREAW